MTSHRCERLVLRSGISSATAALSKVRSKKSASGTDIVTRDGFTPSHCRESGRKRRYGVDHKFDLQLGASSMCG